MAWMKGQRIEVAGQFCTTGPNISLGGIWVGWSFRLNMGGINPTVCHPNPRPTTLRFVWHINTSVPKSNKVIQNILVFFLVGLGGMNDWKSESQT